MISGSDDVRTFCLNRPQKGNSLSSTLVEALHEAFDQFERSGGRVAILRGEGKHLCTGFDLAQIADASAGDLLLRFVRIEQLLARLWSASFATIAVAHGRATGAGADLFTACAHRIALDDARFSFPGAGFGIVLGARRLGVRVG